MPEQICKQSEGGKQIEVMPERTTIATRLSSKWMRTFTFAVGAAAMAWLSSRPTGAQSDLKVAWSPNLHLRSVEDIPQRLREPEWSEHLRLAKGKASLEAGNYEKYFECGERRLRSGHQPRQ